MSASRSLEGLFRKAAVHPVARPSSLSLSAGQSSCWNCPVCRAARTRCPPGQFTRRSSAADDLPVPIRRNPDHAGRALEHSLPPPPPDFEDSNEENVTEVSVLSEEGYIIQDEAPLVQPGSFRHYDADASHHIYEDLYSEAASTDTVRTNNYHLPLQNSPRTPVGRRTPYTKWAHSERRSWQPSRWPPYMPPTPPIPHEYYALSRETPSRPGSSYPTSGFGAGKSDLEASCQASKVRFCNTVKIRIIFADGDRDLIIDSQLVDAFRFGPVIGFGPIRVVVVALTSWMSWSFGTGWSTSYRRRFASSSIHSRILKCEMSHLRMLYMLK